VPGRGRAARRALLALLDDASARPAAVEALAAFPHPDTETALLKLLDGPERWAALTTLAAVWQRSDLGPLRAALLDEPAHDAERLRVALALGGTRRADALEPLLAFFQREHPDAWRAADALARLGHPGAADALTSALEHAAPVERSLTLLRALTAALAGTGQQPSLDWSAWLTHADARVASTAHDLLLATTTGGR
jgi:HEAT repeat protein